ERVGGNRSIQVDVRVLVATHRDLEQLVSDGSFRQDLFHRLFVVPLRLPPLRDRLDDIDALIDHFSQQVAAQNGWKPATFLPEAIERLRAYSWPGNIRELRNVVERLSLLAAGEVQAADVDLALPRLGAPPAAEPLYDGPLSDRTTAFERDVVTAELKLHGFRMSETARALGLERSHLYKKCQQLGIDVQALRESE
ncbi:MAG: sigma-54-dependent Fis family transcriptional regulator, partial [bacterium]|nr:sigma-54-dependent Fis family transcriptional regulator [bacterium]